MSTGQCVACGISGNRRGRHVEKFLTAKITFTYVFFVFFCLPGVEGDEGGERA